jgi:7-cyano-7-deazaguanine synthase
MNNRIVVLHSGGMDSTTLLYKAKSEGAEVISLGIDYGQRLSIEMLFASNQCKKIGVTREVISLSWRKPDREIPLNRTPDEMRSSVSSAFLPGRNVVFLSLACAHAAGLDANEVHIGLNCVDFSGYPDCTREFFSTYQAMTAVANPNGPALKAPFGFASANFTSRRSRVFKR